VSPRPPDLNAGETTESKLRFDPMFYVRISASVSMLAWDNRRDARRDRDPRLFDLFDYYGDPRLKPTNAAFFS